MWMPSDGAVGDLVMCELPYFASTNFKEPGKTNQAWWQKHGIDVPQFISREDLFRNATAVRKSQDDDELMNLLWHILAWGVVGNFRNVSQIVDEAQNDKARPRIQRTLRAALDASFQGRIKAAYRVFLDEPIRQLGPGFFTKFLYFTGDRQSPDARCLILDSLAAMAVNAITNRNYNYVQGAKRRSAQRYDEYCRLLTRQAKDRGAPPDLAEFRLYQLGKLFPNRCSWIAAELSLYRQGSTPTSFDDIAQVLVAQR